MRLAPLAEEAMAEPEEADRAGQHGRVFRRAMPLLGEDGRNLLVGLARGGAAEDLLLHRLGRGQASQGAHGHRHDRGRRVASPPDDAHLQGVGSTAVDNDLVDEAAEERFLLLR
jgi:hypothetical protein